MTFVPCENKVYRAKKQSEVFGQKLKGFAKVFHCKEKLIKYYKIAAKSLCHSFDTFQKLKN